MYVYIYLYIYIYTYIHITLAAGRAKKEFSVSRRQRVGFYVVAWLELTRQEINPRSSVVVRDGGLLCGGASPDVLCGCPLLPD